MNKSKHHIGNKKTRDVIYFAKRVTFEFTISYKTNKYGRNKFSFKFTIINI